MYKNIQSRQAGDVVGYREYFKTGVIQGGMKVSMTFGIDASGKPTKPAVFTQEGVKPLAHIVKERTYNGVVDFMKSHSGLYSVSKVTLGMCNIQGKVINGQWSPDTQIEIYVPRRATTNGVEFIQLSEGRGVGVVHFENLGQLKKYVLNTILPYIRDRETFLTARIQ